MDHPGHQAEDHCWHKQEGLTHYCYVMQITDNNLYFPRATQWTKNTFYVIL